MGVEINKVKEKDFEGSKNNDETESELEVRVDAIRESMDETNEMLKELVRNFDKMFAYKEKFVEDNRVEDKDDVVVDDILLIDISMMYFHQ